MQASLVFFDPSLIRTIDNLKSDRNKKGTNKQKPASLFPFRHQCTRREDYQIKYFKFSSNSIDSKEFNYSEPHGIFFKPDCRGFKDIGF